MANNRAQETFAHTRQKGNLGEDIACKYLINKGFLVISRNYRRAWGELDIVTKKDDVLHFIEVKSIFVDNFDSATAHKPEENVHRLKQRNIGRMIQTFILGTGMNMDTQFFFHVVTVLLNSRLRIARVSMIENVVIS